MSFCDGDYDFGYSDALWTGLSDQISADEPEKQPLREKNRKNPYKHVPHKEKAPQVVERRNARERNRVHAVNTAFVTLKKMIPIQNGRGKRVSKVKTLQNAIRYIRELETILQIEDSCEIYYNKYYEYNYEEAVDSADLSEAY